MMKMNFVKASTALLAASLLFFTACKKPKDVHVNPYDPQTPGYAGGILMDGLVDAAYGGPIIADDGVDASLLGGVGQGSDLSLLYAADSGDYWNFAVVSKGWDDNLPPQNQYFQLYLDWKGEGNADALNSEFNFSLANFRAELVVSWELANSGDTSLIWLSWVPSVTDWSTIHYLSQSGGEAYTPDCAAGYPRNLEFRLKKETIFGSDRSKWPATIRLFAVVYQQLFPPPDSMIAWDFFPDQPGYGHGNSLMYPNFCQTQWVTLTAKGN